MDATETTGAGEPQAIRLDLRGGVNGLQVEVTGEGSVRSLGHDLGRARLELALAVDRRLECWDPALLAGGLLDAVVLLAPALVRAGGAEPDVDLPILVSARQILVDEQHRDAGEGHVVGQVVVTGGVLRFQAQLVRCETRLEVGERVARISVEGEASMAVVPYGVDGVAVTSSWEAESSRGNTYLALTTTRVWALPEGWESTRVRVEEAEVRTDPRRPGHVKAVVAVALE